MKIRFRFTVLAFNLVLICFLTFSCRPRCKYDKRTTSLFTVYTDWPKYVSVTDSLTLQQQLYCFRLSDDFILEGSAYKWQIEVVVTSRIFKSNWPTGNMDNPIIAFESGQLPRVLNNLAEIDKIRDYTFKNGDDYYRRLIFRTQYIDHNDLSYIFENGIRAYLIGNVGSSNFKRIEVDWEKEEEILESSFNDLYDCSKHQ